MTWLDETAVIIALLRTGDRHWHEWAASVEEVGSALELLELERTGTADDQLFPTGELPGDPELANARQDVEHWQREGMRIVTILDDTYPTNLRTIHNLPPLLFVAGELLSSDEKSVAVVGARQASEAGLELAGSIATGLVAHEYTVVSGLAEGIDAAAHQAAADADGRTVAVIGTGLRRSYPAKNAELQQRIAREAAVVSQFWPEQPPTKMTFPMRNAVMSGLAMATVVVEATAKSGSRMQARLALEHGRRVFLPETLVRGEDWARDFAERPGTTVFSSVEEIVDHLDRAYAAAPLTV